MVLPFLACLCMLTLGAGVCCQFGGEGNFVFIFSDVVSMCEDILNDPRLKKYSPVWSVADLDELPAHDDRGHPCTGEVWK